MFRAFAVAYAGDSKGPLKANRARRFGRSGVARCAADWLLRRAGPGLAAVADREPGPHFGPREGHRSKRRAQADRGAFLGPGPFLRVQKWPWRGAGRGAPRP